MIGNKYKNNSTIMDKRTLYEHIMQNVAIEVKKALLEMDDINEGECCDCGCQGGVGAPYATLNNTIGVADVVPAGINTLGSGDRFDMGTYGGDKKKKKRKRKIVMYTKK